MTAAADRPPSELWYFSRDRWRRVSANGIEPNRASREDASEPDREQIAACRLWLRTFAVATDTIRKRRTSYGYKHDVEAWTRGDGRTYDMIDPREGAA